MGILEKLFGKTSDKEIRRIEPIVNKVMGLESAMAALSDEDIAETLEVADEAFSVIKERHS